MKRKNKVFICFIALFVIGVVMITDAAASSETTVYVDPERIEDPQMVPGTQFTVDIVVENVDDLWAYQFWLSFNPDVIKGVEVENGPFLGSAGGEVAVAPGAGFDNQQGELKLFGASIFFTGEVPEELLPTGGGVLASVTFEVVGYGNSPITLGPETGLANKTGGWQLGGAYCYGWYWEPHPWGEGGDWVPYEPWLENLGHGYFANADVHDVAVTHISTEARWCVQGDPIHITVIVENLGDFTETFDVKVYSVQMGTSDEEIFIGTETVNGLASGHSETLFFVWDTTGVSCGSYYIYAEASMVPDESARTINNIASTRFAGICVEPYEATLLELVVSWLSFAMRAALPAAVFVMIAVVFFKTLTSVRVRGPTRLWKRA